MNIVSDSPQIRAASSCWFLRVLMALVLSCASLTLACDGGGSNPIAPGPGPGDDLPFETFALGEKFDAEIEAATELDSAKLDEASPLPSWVDHSSGLPPVRSQGGSGACSAFAVGYYLKTWQEKKEENWSVASEGSQFSAAYLYNQRPGFPVGDSGMTTVGPPGSKATIALVVEGGCCTWAAAPIRDSDLWAKPLTWIGVSPTAAMREEASGFKALDCGALGKDPFALKQHLATGGSRGTGEPFVVGLNVANLEVWFGYKGTNEGVFSDADKGFVPGAGFGHAMCVVGYDDTKGGGCFKLVNSWGKDWGLGGFCYIPYPTFMRIGRVFGRLTDKSNTRKLTPSNPASDNNDTPDTAVTVYNGTSLLGSASATDPDWYKITVNSDEKITVRLTQLNGDADIGLYSRVTTGATYLQAVSENSGTLDETISQEIATGGTYYVKVSSDVTAAVSYKLSLIISAAVDDPPPTEPNNSKSGADVLISGGSVAGRVGGEDPCDWFKFTASQGQTITLDMTNLQADLDLFYYSPTATTSTTSSTKGGSTAEKIALSASAGGTHYVQVKPYSSAVSSYTLTLTLTSVAAGTPDLKPGAVSFTRSITGTSVTITASNVSVANIGTGSAGSFDAGIGISRSSTSGYYSMNSTAVSFSGVSASSSVLRSSATVSFSNLSEGPYWVVVRADSTNKVSETNESNNYAYSTSSFTIAAKPDLVISSWDATSWSKSGSTVTIKMTEIKVENRSTASTGSGYNVVVGLATSKTSAIYADFNGTPWKRTSAQAGSTVLTWTGGQTAVTVPAGSYYLVVWADPGNSGVGTIPESNEQNNLSYSTQTITVP
ncbi:MAG: pre-peptidase C-terminal domain-containing protein [Planctomycetes bacterium]|nr:pre-peptidase C-terminal domain-containing protein [Planctomycetota bacterium]